MISLFIKAAISSQLSAFSQGFASAGVVANVKALVIQQNLKFDLHKTEG
jgi:hypothetical protein